MRSVQVAVTFLALLAMAQQSLQLSFKNSLRQVVDRSRSHNVNIRVFNNFGIVLSSDSIEKAFIESNAFTASPTTPYVDLSGRRFHIGKISNMDVVYVKSGGSTMNTVITVQTLASAFPDLEGIVQIGNAGAVNGSLSIGDVSVPSEIAYIGNWKWENFLTREKKGPLQFGEYNLPEPGLNTLQSIAFKPLKLYPSSNTGNAETVFWLHADEFFLETASELQGSKLAQCASATNCLSEKPKVVVGLRATSADIYVVNEAFRLFIKKHFKSSTVDTNSAALAFTASTNILPFISFLGVSNEAGGPVTESSSNNLASVNAVNAAVEFINSLPQPFDNGHY